MQQLLLFPETEQEILRKEMEKIKGEISNTRKGLFSRHSELQKKYDSLHHEFEMLRYAVCNFREDLLAK